LRSSDFEAIEAAVMETEKGRWFLAEYATRHRAANTDEVLGAIQRLEGLLKRERRPDADRIRLDIGEMKDAIERTKLEIAQIKSDGRTPLSRFDRASNELDAIVEQTEAATSEILGAAEKVQEIAFTMRENGVDAQFCDDIENYTTTIYMACSFQDLTGQRTQKVVQVLRYLENRINAMIEIWGMNEEEVASSTTKTRTTANPMDRRPDAHLLNGPALAGEGIEQNIVDNLMVEDEEADAAALDTVTNHAIDAMDFDRIDALTALTGETDDEDGETLPEIRMDADGQIDFDAIVVDGDDEPVAEAAADAEVEAGAEDLDAADLADLLHFDPIDRAAPILADASDEQAAPTAEGFELELDEPVHHEAEAIAGSGGEDFVARPSFEDDEAEEPVVDAEAEADALFAEVEAEDAEEAQAEAEDISHEDRTDDLFIETGAGEPDDELFAEPKSDAITEAAIAIAADAVDTAIDALKEVSEIAKAKGTDAVDDPFEKMTKTERQALFS
jgi:chemotaxis regulatin CheY-phosphate phosphatase CheZ